MIKSLTKALPQKIFFLFFAGIPLLASSSLFPAYFKAVESYFYQESQCTIIENRREKLPSEGYMQILLYGYQYGDQNYTGTVYRSDIDGYSSNNRHFFDKSFRKKKPDDVVPCFVNPKNPAESVIMQGPVTPWYYIVLLVFLHIIGLAGLYAAFFKPDWTEKNVIMDGDAT